MKLAGLCHLSECGGPNIQPCLGQPIPAYPKDIKRFYLTIRLDKCVKRWAIPDVFELAISPHHDSRDVPKVRDSQIQRSLKPPVVEDWY
jgi:hypothetical protein